MKMAAFFLFVFTILRKVVANPGFPTWRGDGRKRELSTNLSFDQIVVKAAWKIENLDGFWGGVPAFPPNLSM